MTNPLHDHLEQAYAELAEKKAAFAGFEREMAAGRSTVSAKNRALTVTVDAAGDLQEVKFPTNAYRKMAPAELGQLLVDTIGTAREQAREKAFGLLGSLLPAGTPIMEMLSGPVDLDSMMDEAMRPFKQFRPSDGQPTSEEGAK